MGARVLLAKGGEDDAARAARARAERGVKLLKLAVAARVEQGEETGLERGFGDDADAAAGDGGDGVGEQVGAITVQTAGLGGFVHEGELTGAAFHDGGARARGFKSSQRGEEI